MTKWVGLILVAIIIQSCSSSVEEKNLVGIWAADDGAIIELNKGNNAKIKNIDLSKVYYDPNSTKEIVSFEGKWEFDSKANKVHIESRRSFPLEVKGQGLLENKPPFSLVIWIGDPDDMMRYEFVKRDGVYKK